LGTFLTGVASPHSVTISAGGSAAGFIRFAQQPMIHFLSKNVRFWNIVKNFINCFLSKISLLGQNIFLTVKFDVFHQIVIL